MTRFLKYAVLVAVLASVSSAVEIVQTHDFGTFYPGNGLSPYVDTWSFNKFDTHDGDWTLNSIRIEFVLYAWDGFLGQDNDGTTGASGDVGFDVLAEVDASGVTLLKDDFSSSWSSLIRQQDTFTLLANDGDGDGSQEGGSDWDSLSGPDENNKVAAIIDANISSVVFGGYTGSGTFDMTLSAEQTLYLLGGAVSTSSDPQKASEFVRMTYDFVPEPMTLSLMGAGGLVALMANRLRRRD